MEGEEGQGLSKAKFGQNNRRRGSEREWPRKVTLLVGGLFLIAPMFRYLYRSHPARTLSFSSVRKKATQSKAKQAASPLGLLAR